MDSSSTLQHDMGTSHFRCHIGYTSIYVCMYLFIYLPSFAFFLRPSVPPNFPRKDSSFFIFPVCAADLAISQTAVISFTSRAVSQIRKRHAQDTSERTCWEQKCHVKALQRRRQWPSGKRPTLGRTVRSDSLSSHRSGLWNAKRAINMEQILATCIWLKPLQHLYPSGFNTSDGQFPNNGSLCKVGHLGV